MVSIGSNLFDTDTCPSGYIGLGLGCYIYVDTTTKVISGLLKCETTMLINGLVKCELLAIVGRIDVWVGLDPFRLMMSHVLQDILDWR